MVRGACCLSNASKCSEELQDLCEDSATFLTLGSKRGDLEKGLEGVLLALVSLLSPCPVDSGCVSVCHYEIVNFPLYSVASLA